ncbi:hypothetical protein PCANC_03577 [Puccinia coronata f. sp. avenae]|uniref:Uncharacterized protein n=1 Tax=Puccinia coronata f. sp. avenae TaxID=200324 RepID=A0A2N5VV20_9BASI|nr:hypothetical protein PCANC_03577 [Puccinia coronata f. sp. avenae]
MEVFQEEDKDKVIKNLQGCHEHFCAQVTRIKRNRTVIFADDKGKFANMCTALLKRPLPECPTHNNKMDELRQHPDGNDGQPETTNAQESMHMLYSIFILGKKSMLLGMVELFYFAKSLKEDYYAVICGVSIEYGSQTKGQIDVSQSMGWTKPRKCIHHQDINDGRAPDTTQALAQDDAPVVKHIKKLGRPPGLQNVERNRGLIVARPKGVRTPPQTPKKKACGGCTPSHTGVQTPARPPPHAARRLHAYKWREDGLLGVRPRRTGVLAMHACLEGVQALHALRTGVHGRHACPARLTVPNGTLLRVPNGTLIRVPNGTFLRVPNGTLLRVPNGTLLKVPNGTLIRVPNGTLLRVPNGTLLRVPNGTLIRVPNGTLIRVPNGTLIRVPNGTLIRVLSGTPKRVPLGTLIRVPSSTLIRVLSSTLIRVPSSTLIRVLSSTLIRVPRGSRKPLDLRGLREPGRTGVPAVHACLEGVQGLHALRTGVHGQHACPAGKHAKPAVLTPFVGVRTACGMQGFAHLYGKACSPRTPFFQGFGGACARPSGVPLSSPKGIPSPHIHHIALLTTHFAAIAAGWLQPSSLCMCCTIRRGCVEPMDCKTTCPPTW